MYIIVSHNLIKKCFKYPWKLYSSHYIDNHQLIAQSYYMKYSPHFSSHFGQICILYLKICRGVAVEILKNIKRFYTCFKLCSKHDIWFFQMTKTGGKRSAKSQRNLIKIFKKPRKVVLETGKSTKILRFKFISQIFRRYFVGKRGLSRK